MNVILKRLYTSLLLLSFGLCSASSHTGKIAYIIVRASDGLIYFELEGVRTGKPACAQQQEYFMIKSEGSLVGRQQYALLLLAKAAGKAVMVTGTGECSRWRDGEDLDGVRLAE